MVFFFNRNFDKYCTKQILKIKEEIKIKSERMQIMEKNHKHD